MHSLLQRRILPGKLWLSKRVGWITDDLPKLTEVGKSNIIFFLQILQS